MYHQLRDKVEIEVCPDPDRHGLGGSELALRPSRSLREALSGEGGMVFILSTKETSADPSG